MKHQLAELVNVILQHIEESAEAPPSETGLRSLLAREGYKKRDIEAAMRLVMPRFHSEVKVVRSNPGSVRHLSPYERYKFSSEVRDALARLELYELLDPYERELLMERLTQLEGMVTMEDLDYALSTLTCMTRDVETQHTIFDVLEGGGESRH